MSVITGCEWAKATTGKIGDDVRKRRHERAADLRDFNDCEIRSRPVSTKEADVTDGGA